MPSIRINGRRYDYLLFAAPAPVAIVIAFHGLGGYGAAARDQMRLHERGAPIVVAYPSGWWGTWDARPGSVDSLMTGALMAKLRQAYGPLPVHLVGISAGASMAYRAACEQDVAKLAAVAAGLNPVTANGAPDKLVHLHGDSDSLVPFLGGGPLGVPPMQAGIDLLAALGCAFELRVIAGGGHAWDFGVGHDTTGAILAAWGVA